MCEDLVAKIYKRSIAYFSFLTEYYHAMHLAKRSINFRS